MTNFFKKSHLDLFHAKKAVDFIRLKKILRLYASKFFKAKLHYFFNNDAYLLDFRAQKFLSIFFNVDPFQH